MKSGMGIDPAVFWAQFQRFCVPECAMRTLIPVLWLLFLPGCESNQADRKKDVVNSSTVSPPGQFQLQDQTRELGIDLSPGLPRPDDYHMPDIMGYGCGVLDADRDGDVDLIFAIREHATTRQSGLEVQADSRSDQASKSLVWPGAFYRQDSKHRFERMVDSESSHHGTPMGIATGDVNNDGWPDVLITCFGEDQLYLNQSGNGFVDVTEAAGISNPRWGTSACFFDYDRDGWLDLYVTNYVDYFPQDCVQLSGVNPDFCGPQRFKATRDCLFRNTTGESSNAAVQFEEVTLASGIGELQGKGLGVTAADFTGDGWQDLYVANDQEPNFLWVNQQDGTFREEAVLLGCATDHLGNSQASMGVCVHDFNDDGQLDILVTHIDGERNTLYLGTSVGDFRDGTLDSAFCRQSFGLTGFGVATTDLDGDGVDEVLVANGRVRRPDGSISPSDDFWAPYRQSAMVHSSQGASPLLSTKALFRGLVCSDVDDDGDRDVILTSIDQSPVVVCNEHSARDRSVLMVQAVLPDLGERDALGATVLLQTDRRVTRRLIQTCGSYLSATMPVVEFSLSPGEAFRELIIRWPDGQQESFSELPDGRHVKLEKGFGTSIE